MVDVRAEVVSVLCADGAGHVEILAVAARGGSDFDGRRRDLHVCELRSLVVEVDLGRDEGAVDVAIEAGVVAIEHEVFDEGTDEEGHQVIKFVVVAGGYTLVVVGRAEGLIGRVEADLEHRVAL